MKSRKFTLSIVDDHKLFRNGLRLLLVNSYPNIEITEANDGNEYLQSLATHLPDVTLMDISMPIIDGIEATRRATELYPDIRIIALSMFGDEAYYYKMIDAGVKGFLLKNSEIAEVREAIESVMAGDHYFSNELLLSIVKNLNKKSLEEDTGINLSERETEILQLICLGLSNKEISEKLFLSKRTVDKHRANILFKTNSRNTAHLVMNTIKHKWIVF
ncbi:MAG: response regulator transcription factor [Bacteroidales bacterium]|jgi:DNA-binding NarL/FixJ family response regulator|nr:response regulator transcription factor [Bacteroidales bacterium]MDI9593572.1 response regulator transcription factor [Bacteroidota bacterium]NLH33816.1 response regulator transcription factor [Lentimicrobium sp.]OQC37927.1 MAG: Oxygen regulatory protein NreC [Bacteroidetes bacterium ADurb.Bin041]MBP7873303.1 response regulator transcription factor [Bacteroidales bacterium]